MTTTGGGASVAEGLDVDIELVQRGGAEYPCEGE